MYEVIKKSGLPCKCEAFCPDHANFGMVSLVLCECGCYDMDVAKNDIFKPFHRAELHDSEIDAYLNDMI